MTGLTSWHLLAMPCMYLSQVACRVLLLEEANKKHTFFSLPHDASVYITTKHTIGHAQGPP